MNAFQEFYSKTYPDRWKELERALLRESEKSVRDCFGGHANYVMDQASIRAGLALGVRPGDLVLDLCAAPGGKSLILAEALEGRGSLTANELSSQRRRRLKEVISTHVPGNLQSLILVTGFDGNQFGLRKKESYDRVLLDAPCSSERHQMEADPSMTEWKESRSRQLAQRQYSLICSALLSLKPGGTLLYSTCSISPFENDGVIERLLTRKGDQVRLDPETGDLTDLEKSPFGFRIFPDRSGGSGPIFLSRLLRT